MTAWCITFQKQASAFEMEFYSTFGIQDVLFTTRAIAPY
jgi:hypothetical protein